MAFSVLSVKKKETKRIAIFTFITFICDCIFKVRTTAFLFLALQDVRRTEGSQAADRFAEEVDRTTAQQLSPALHTTTGQNGTVVIRFVHG